MNRKQTLYAGFFLAVAGNVVNAADLVLAAHGRSEYQIVVPEEPLSPSIGEALQQAARLVQTAFGANGFTVPVVSEGQRDPARPGIYLGQTEFARAHGVEVSQLRGWGYVHKVVGRDVIIAGHDQPHPAPPEGAEGRRPLWDRLGTVKGVADFLREYVGTRFLYPDLGPWATLQEATGLNLLESPAFEFLEVPVITVPSDLDRRKSPVLEYNVAYPPRGSFYDLANNRFPLVDTVFDGHTYERAIPVEKYYDAHPTYFALVGGQRLRQGQYCISNPEVQELLFQDLIRWLDQGYEAVDLGQPDGFQPCQCDRCRALFDTGADWSEKLWILHRHLAERVQEARPGKRVTLMAYALTETPPKTFRAFPPNTRLMLCGTNEEDLEKWRGFEVPGGFVAYLYNWCPNLGTRYTPMRTPRFIEAQVRRLVRDHIHGIHRDGPGLLFGLEGPVYYVMGRMFDDPENLQAQELVDEFCLAAFGEASAPMQEFYDRLYHGIELYSEYLGTRSPAWAYRDLYGQPRKYLTDPFQLIGFLYTPSLLASLDEDLTRAENAAPSDKVRARLALVRREFNYVKSLARVVHLYQAFQMQPDLALRSRLLDAIDARNAEIASYYDAAGNPRPLPGWSFVMFPPPGHDANHLRLAYDGYQEPYKDTPVNWDTQAMREAPLPDPGQKRESLQNSVQEIRESLYRATFEVPDEWRNLSSPLPAPWGPWTFRKDPMDRGIREGWYRRDVAGEGWLPVRVPAFWAETEVGDYVGYGWYRTTFEVPSEWQGKTLRLLFGGVDEQAWVYVNGELVGEHTEESEGFPADQLWEIPFAVEVGPEHLRFGEPNVLVVRVHNAQANGGIWRPVLAHAVE